MSPTLVRYQKQHGTRALDFARCCAVPVALTPELVHLIRCNLFPDLPYVAESDLLFSSLTEEAGPGLYEMRRDLRMELLAELRGREDGRRVAQLLARYGRTRLPWAAPGEAEETRHASLEQAQQFAALAWLQPDRARGWLASVNEAGTSGMSREWFVAMEREIPLRQLKVFVGSAERSAQRFGDALLRQRELLYERYAETPGIEMITTDYRPISQPKTRRRDLVAQSDLLILLLDRDVIQPKSRIEEEHEAAIDASIPRLIYVLGDPAAAETKRTRSALTSNHYQIVRCWQEQADLEALIDRDLSMIQTGGWPLPIRDNPLAGAFVDDAILESVADVLDSVERLLVQQLLCSWPEEALGSPLVELQETPLADRFAVLVSALAARQPALSLSPSDYAALREFLSRLFQEARESAAARLAFRDIERLGGYPTRFLAPRTIAEYREQLVTIPGGTFQMGAAKSEWSDERPVHSVTLSSFRLGKSAVTVGMWSEFCVATNRAMPGLPNYPVWQSGWDVVLDHPIVNVSWEDCQAYADWAGLSLPSEAQWEYAARGPEGLEFPWGSGFDTSKLWCSIKGWGDVDGTASVDRQDRISASWCGLVDMAGNVFEWCSDWYSDSYYGSPAAKLPDPVGPQSGSSKVVRGGSWGNYVAVDFRCAYRNYSTPSDRFFIIGFRLSSGP
jgi:formylglycine-generating enzyme